MRIRTAAVFAALVFAVACPACAKRNCVPEELTKSRNLIDLSADPEAHAPVSGGLTREVEAEFRRRTAAATPPGARPYHFLALSGGGLYGSFGVGIMNGWTESGVRPTFDVVTGISTGALISTYAFLGSDYDAALRENIIGVERGDILRRRSLVRIPFADAIYTSQPLGRRIEEAITPCLLAEVAKAHAAGRRLYVGTTNIESHRLVMWDMGAIAARGTAESLKLYRDVVLASCSIPGAFPPVRIPVEIDGKWYEELHVDGGVSDEIIFRAFMVGDLNRAAGRAGAHAPAGSVLYVISNGKLYATAKCLKPALTDMIGASFKSIVYGKTRDELYRIYLNCLETGVDFRVTAIPQDFELANTAGLGISKEDQNRLFEVGKAIGRRPGVGQDWRDLPPGTNAAEQSLPRAGTRFLYTGAESGKQTPPAETPGPLPGLPKPPLLQNE